MKDFLSTRWKGLTAPFASDRLLLIAAVAAALVFVLSTALVVVRVEQTQQRISLRDLQAGLPLAQIAQIQRELLLLQHSLSEHEHDPGQSPSRVQQDALLVDGDIASLLRPTELTLLPEPYFSHMGAAGENWELIRAHLSDWVHDQQNLELSDSIQAEVSQLELEFNEIDAEVNLFSRSLDNQANQVTATEASLDQAVIYLDWLILGLLAFIYTRLSRYQVKVAVERESMRKFPDHSPNPVMRFDPRHKLVYGNPASKEIEPIFAMQDGRVTNPEITTWLDRTFQEGGSSSIDSNLGERIFRLASSLVEEEHVVNVYGVEITSLKRAEQDSLRQLARLKALRQIDLAIASPKDLESTLEEVLTQTRQNLGLDAATIFIPSEEGELYCAAYQGFRTKLVAGFHLHIGDSLVGHVAQGRQLLSLPDLTNSELKFSPGLQKHEGFVSYFAAPLEVRGQLLGVIEGLQRQRFSPDQEWLDFFATLAGQAAIALDNASLFDGLKASNLELQQAYDTTLEGWAKALELRDKETVGHSRRVSTTTMLMAKELGLPEDLWDDMRRGAILHDIGKMGVPDAILQKPGPLDAAELAIIHQHTEYARQMLSSIPFLSSAMDIPYSHHERWDGSGYPQRLKGEDIPLPARIFAIVDVWDALRSDRPYRARWPKQQAIQHIQDESGHHFDPQVVAAFMRLVNAGTIE